MDFPVVGPQGPTWTLTVIQLRELHELYPTLPLEKELVKMQAWLWGNPQKRKTARGMTRFMANWLNKALDEQLAWKATFEQAPREHWTEECKREHHLRCIHQSEHRIRMYQQQEKANAPDVA